MNRATKVSLLTGVGLVAMMGYAPGPSLQCSDSDWGVTAHSRFIDSLSLSDDSLHVRLSIPGSQEYVFSSSPDAVLYGGMPSSLSDLEQRLRSGDEVVSLRGELTADGSFDIVHVHFNHVPSDAYKLCKLK